MAELYYSDKAVKIFVSPKSTDIQDYWWINTTIFIRRDMEEGFRLCIMDGSKYREMKFMPKNIMPPEEVLKESLYQAEIFIREFWNIQKKEPK